MVCETTELEGLGVIVCMRGVRPKKCRYCGAAAVRLCDAKRTPRSKRTCDTPMCSRCTFNPAADVDYCREHRS